MEFKLKIFLLGEYREQFESKIEGLKFNAHPSLSSIQNIVDACKEKNMHCEYFGGVIDLVKAIDLKQKFDEDTIFINFSDGLEQDYCRLQAPVLLELLNVKYTGSSPFPVALMNNKHHTKIAVKNLLLSNLNMPEDFFINRNSVIDKYLFQKLKFPIIIKPNNDGFSLGITSESIINESVEKAIIQIQKLQNEYDEIIVEEYIPGMDVSVFMLGNKDNILINDVIAYKTNHKLFQDKEARDIYNKANKLSQKLDARKVLSEDIILTLQNLSKDIFNGLNARDIARIDYRITKSGQVYFLEINSCPILSKESDLKIVCEISNISYSDFIELYIKTAYNRYD